MSDLSDAYDILRRQADDLAAALKEARGLLRRYTEFPTCAKCQGYEMCEDCADEYAAIQADADAFLAGQPATDWPPADPPPTAMTSGTRGSCATSGTSNGRSTRRSRT